MRELVGQKPSIYDQGLAKHKDVVLLSNVWKSVTEMYNHSIHPTLMFAILCCAFFFFSTVVDEAAEFCL